MRNKSLYPENWCDEIRPSILKRDNYKCCDCGIKHRVYVFFDEKKKRVVVTKDEYEYLKENGYRTYRIYLQVAHLNNIKSDCRPENLVALCNICHHKRDVHHKALMRIAKLLS